MGKIKESNYTEYDDKLLDDEEDFLESEIAEDDEDGLLDDEEDPGYKRTWRDAEKYKEMRELYKIINDDLYTGFDEEEFLDEDEH